MTTHTTDGEGTRRTRSAPGTESPSGGYPVMKKWEGGKFQFGKAIGVAVEVIARGEREEDGAVRREDAGHVPVRGISPIIHKNTLVSLFPLQRLEIKLVLRMLWFVRKCTDSVQRMKAIRSCCNISSSEKKKHDQLHYQSIVVHHRSPPTLPALCSQQIQVVPRVRVRRRRRDIRIIAVVACGPKTVAPIRSLQKCRRVTKMKGREGRVTLPRV